MIWSQNFLYRLLPHALWVWLIGRRNRILRQKCLVQNMNSDHLFARKPQRRISCFAVSHPDNTGI